MTRILPVIGAALAVWVANTGGLVALAVGGLSAGRALASAYAFGREDA